MVDNKLYPLKFVPIFKDKIWGGRKLIDNYGKQTTSEKLGESWELSACEGDESVVANGFLADNNLIELIEIYMGDLVGDSVYDKFGLSFPLLFKLIDANDNLSIQVHPNDEIAAERHNSFGKTEMWYVVDADPEGTLTVGFKEDCTKDVYLSALANDRVGELLQTVPVKQGDVFLIPAGLIHSIGKGVVIAEIQESSDLTYRIYDYKRKDENGNERKLHTEQALDVINFSASNHPKITYKSTLNEITPLAKCEYFTTNFLRIDKKNIRNYVGLDSFITYMCLEGCFTVNYNNTEVAVNKGETILIPAYIDELELIPDSKETTLLEVYVEL